MAIDYGMPVVFSLEMASVQLITFISSETGLSSENCVGKLENTNGTIEY
jgi:hypothetical protein